VYVKKCQALNGPFSGISSFPVWWIGNFSKHGGVYVKKCQALNGPFSGISSFPVWWIGNFSKHGGE
jgi:prenyltransferase beta subunit